MSNTKKVTISLTPEQQDKARSLSKDLFGKENISYRSDEVSIKVKANTISATGMVNTKEVDAFIRHSTRLGFSHFKVGDRVEIEGHILTIKGFNTRASKSPIQLEANGRPYKCTVASLKNRQPIK